MRNRSTKSKQIKKDANKKARLINRTHTHTHMDLWKDAKCRYLVSVATPAETACRL